MARTVAGAALAGLLIVGLCGTSRAAVLFNSLANALSDFDPASQDAPLAQSFSTGANAFKLSSVTLSLNATAAPSGGSYVVTLVSNVPNGSGAYGAPDLADAALATLGTGLDSDLSLTGATMTFNLVSAYRLSANTMYWIVVQQDPASVVGWAYSLDTAGTGVSSAYSYDTNDGTSPSVAIGPYLMEVTGTTVALTGTRTPEPATLLTLGAGLIGLGVARRRRSVAITS